MSWSDGTRPVPWNDHDCSDPLPLLFHGTNHPAREGDEISPGYPTHYPGAYCDDDYLNYVHATPALETAWQHADNAVHEDGGTHHVYQVEPTGSVTWGDETFDEDFANAEEMNRRGNRMSEYPFRAVRELAYDGQRLPYTGRYCPVTRPAAHWQPELIRFLTPGRLRTLARPSAADDQVATLAEALTQYGYQCVLGGADHLDPVEITVTEALTQLSDGNQRVLALAEAGYGEPVPVVIRDLRQDELEAG